MIEAGSASGGVFSFGQSRQARSLKRLIQIIHR